MGTTNGVHQANGAAKPPIRIAIVGGGIGGLALALGEPAINYMLSTFVLIRAYLGLANQQRQGANITFQIFEAAPQFKEIGWENTQPSYGLMGI